MRITHSHTSALNKSLNTRRRIKFYLFEMIEMIKGQVGATLLKRGGGELILKRVSLAFVSLCQF